MTGLFHLFALGVLLSCDSLGGGLAVALAWTIGAALLA